MDAMHTVITEVIARDALLAEVIARHELCPLGRARDDGSHFEALVASITSQQLSVRAADSIYARLISLAGGRLSPQSVSELTEAQLRSIGLSGAKVRTIHGLAEAATSGRININQLHEVDDDQHVFDQLTSLWGIGPWTIDMFLMHQLGRLDVWPTGDVGVRRGWQNIYQLSHKIEPNALAVAGEKFRPYRSVLAWDCWREA
jgi:DNA-3-methyladenine glycosylase II